MRDVLIIEAKRTAIGNLGGSLSGVPASKLGATAISHLIQEKNLNPSEIDEVIMGQVLSGGCGQNPARQSAMLASIPHQVPALTINKVCGSGLKSVILGAQSIALDQASVIVAGGQENMSLAPHLAPLRHPVKMGNIPLVDSMIHDGLTDAFHHYHMGNTAENVAKQHDISRDAQDQFAFASQQKASQAEKSGYFADEIIPIDVKQKKETVRFSHDEFIKHNTPLEKLRTLRPAFDPKNGTVTAGNASGINDGAAAVLLTSRTYAEQHHLNPMARIVSYATTGVDPRMMGIGPASAIEKALALAKWSLRDLDLIELNEAFAAQSLAVIQMLKLDTKITNIQGGAIAIGHPIGASGTRCLVTLLHAMKRNHCTKGLVSLCIGGGMGIAMCLSTES